jgi:hypothetical protein
MACPVHSRTERASARCTTETAVSAATRAVSTRCAPLVMTSSGAPPALKMRLFAIAPTSQPSWAAAAAAVGAGSGSSRTSPATPRFRSTAANDVKSTGMPSRLAGPDPARRMYYRAPARAATDRSAYQAKVSPLAFKVPEGTCRSVWA